MHESHPRSGDDAPVVFQICPRCGLEIRARAAWLTPRHCPRCVASSQRAVDMFASSVPAATLYGPDGPGVARAAPAG